MRALQYEGTRAEIAQNFREQGNEMARAKRWKDGKEYYTKGLAALKQPQSISPPAEDGEYPTTQVLKPETEAKKEKEIEEACYINRALCNLELRTFPPSLGIPSNSPNTPTLQKTTAPQSTTAPPPLTSTPPTSKPSTAQLSPSSPSTSSPKPATHAPTA